MKKLLLIVIIITITQYASANPVTTQTTGNIYEITGCTKSSEKYKGCDVWVWNGSATTLTIRAKSSKVTVWTGIDTKYFHFWLGSTDMGKANYNASNLPNLWYSINSSKISGYTKVYFRLYAVGPINDYEYLVTAVYITKATTYTITTSATNGTVTGGGTYDKNASATLTATPNECYQFTQWSDGNTDNPRTVTVTGDATYTAEFEKIKYTITTESDDPAQGSTSATK